VIALIVLTVIKGVVWICAYPMWKIADEPAHFDNVQYRAEHALHGPVWDGGDTARVMARDASPELRKSWAASQKYHHGGRPKTDTVPEEAELTRIAPTPDSRRTSGQMPALNYGGLFYTMGTVPYLMFRHSSVVTRLVAVRFLSLLFGLAAVLCTFFAARCVFDDDLMAFAAAAVVALQPMESQQTAAVNNDAGVIGFAAIAFLLQMRIIKSELLPGIRASLLLGAMTACAVLVKTQGLGMLPGTLVACGALVYRQNSAKSWSRVALVAAAFIVVWQFPRVWGMIHPDPAPEPAALQLAPRALGPFPSLFEFPAWVDALDNGYRGYLFRSAWGQFSWIEFSFRDPWFEMLERIAALSLLGGITAIALWVLQRSSIWWRTWPALFAAGSAFAGVLSILFAEYYSRIHLKLPFVIQGRAFLFALPPFAITVVLALGSMVPRSLRACSAVIIVTGALALNIGALITIVRYHHGG
jgi:hypothetical protein